MSGYIGNPDAEAEHALILAENGISAARAMISGSVLIHCIDCAEEIPFPRREAAIIAGRKCHYCITCQQAHDKSPRIKMLDRIL